MTKTTRYTRQYTVQIIPGQQRYAFMAGWRAKDIVMRETYFKSSNNIDYYAFASQACEIRKDEEGWFFWIASLPIDYGTLLIEVKEKPRKMPSAQAVAIDAANTMIEKAEQ